MSRRSVGRLGELYETPLPDTKNHEGFPAYQADLYDSVAEVLLLGTLGKTFYASAQELAHEAVEVLAAGVAQDPHYVAQAAVLAREEGYVRSAPIVALGLLTAGNEEAHWHARAIFGRIIRTADDLRRFVEFVQTGTTGKRFGGLRQRLVRDWLQLRLDEYQAVKYAEAANRLSLRNILRMTHPVPLNVHSQEIFDWLLHGTVGETVPMIQALSALNQGGADVTGVVEDSRLPWEAVVPRVEKADATVWRSLLPGMPYMALLRSLVTMGRSGVWDDAHALSIACHKLTAPQAVAKSMLFPFRYAQAIQVLQREEAPQELINAVVRAMEASVSNLPSVGGMKLAIAPDVSPSMSMENAHVSKDVTAADIAGIFTAALWKANPNAVVLPFSSPLGYRNTSDDGIHQIHSHPTDSVATIAHEIGKLPGNGTELAAPVRWLRTRNIAVDVFVGLTDSEDWAGGGFLSEWKTYRRVAPEAKAVLVQLTPNRALAAPSNFPGVRYVYGWSDKVLSFVADVAAGQSMADRVRQVTV